MAHREYHVEQPRAAHTHTVIFLHGRDSDGREFADEFFESEASGPVEQPRKLRDLLPGIRWVFPSAAILRSERFGIEMSQWFDIWSVENPAERPDLQIPGLRQSITQILGVIEEEKKLVARDRIFLGGISQGFAAAIMTYVSEMPGGFAGLIGMCSWMPPALRTSEGEDSDILRELQETFGKGQVVRQTPIFLGHAKDDDIVPIKNGRELRDVLYPYCPWLEWREYENGGHWINEPQGVDDIVAFLNENMEDEQDS